MACNQQMIRTNNKKMKSILELPIEVFLEIFSYLSMIDLKKVSLVCSNWYKIVQHPTLRKKVLFTIPKNVAKFNWTRVLQNVQLEKRKFSSKFSWFPFENHIQYIKFNNCNLCALNFLSILKKATYLKTLIVDHCQFDKIPNQMNILDTCGSLKNIKELKVSNVSIKDKTDLSDLFEPLLSVMINIEKLDMDIICEDDHTHGIKAKCFFKHITLIASTLKHLVISCTIELNFIKQLVDIPNLQLLSLSVGKTNNDIILLLNNHRYLNTLSIIDLLDVNTDKIFPFICNNLTNLKSLKISSEKDLPKQMKLMGKLKKLEVLKMDIYLVSKDDLMMGLLKEKNDNLCNLNLENVNYNVFSEIAEKFKNLRILKLDFCWSNEFLVTSTAMQVIWKHLRLLTEISIYIYDPSKITDYGFTGIPETSDEEVGHSISELKDLRVFSLRSYEIFNLSNKIFIEMAKLNQLVRLELKVMDLLAEDIFPLKDCKNLQYLYIEVSYGMNMLMFSDLRKKFRQNFTKQKYLYFGYNFLNFYSFPSSRYDTQCFYRLFKDVENSNVFLDVNKNADDNKYLFISD